MSPTKSLLIWMFTSCPLLLLSAKENLRNKKTGHFIRSHGHVPNNLPKHLQIDDQQHQSDRKELKYEESDSELFSSQMNSPTTTQPNGPFSTRAPKAVVYHSNIQIINDQKTHLVAPNTSNEGHQSDMQNDADVPVDFLDTQFEIDPEKYILDDLASQEEEFDSGLMVSEIDRSPQYLSSRKESTEKGQRYEERSVINRYTHDHQYINNHPSMPIISHDLERYRRKVSTPCELPNLNEAEFEQVCLAHYQTRYICGLNGLSDINLSMVVTLERALGGQFAYCHYDTLENRVTKRPIGDEPIKRQFDEDLKRIRHEIMNHGEDRANTPEVKQKQDTVADEQKLQAELLIRPINLRPAIAFTFLNNFQFDHNDINRYGDIRKCSVLPDMTMPNLSEISHNTTLVMDFFTNVSRSRWSYVDPDPFNDRPENLGREQLDPECETDISIMVVKLHATNTQLGVQSSDTHISVAFSKEYGDIMRENISALLMEMNLNKGLYRNMSLYDKSMHLIDVMFRLLREFKPLHAKIQYTVPDWAKWVFAGCILVSAAAAIVGSWINTKSRTRSMHRPAAAAATANRKWAAGFSGGMWAT